MAGLFDFNVSVQPSAISYQQKPGLIKIEPLTI
jgi:hypothetical protein